MSDRASILTNPAFCKSGLLAHQWKRTSQPDKSRHVCRCTGKLRDYDVEVLESTDCPRCGKPLTHPRMTIRACQRCGEKG